MMSADLLVQKPGHMNVKSKRNQTLFYSLVLLEDGDVTSSLVTI